ncbi:hypothetical protein [Bifidobacterium mongoliense]|uniref:hypothetical protein n=1 Tax=Bifidobacterium mongoliense TaxID=518643 RepID=UPI0030EE710A
MSYLSDGGKYTLTKAGADRLLELENSNEAYPLPADFKSQLVTTSAGVADRLHEMGFRMPEGDK